MGGTSTIDLQADYSFVGENTGQRRPFGLQRSDVDGDGLSDAVSAYGNDDGGTDVGKTYVILGSSLGGTSTIDLSQADYALIGENAYDFSGSVVASAGDVDGDGLSDLLVGADYSDDGGTDAGKTYLILGASLGSASTMDLSQADYAFVGENASDWSGRAVASAGDVDGDGLSDLLVGANGNDDNGTSAGKAYLILGSSLGSNATIDLSQADYIFTGEAQSDYLGGGAVETTYAVGPAHWWVWERRWGQRRRQDLRDFGLELGWHVHH